MWNELVSIFTVAETEAMPLLTEMIVSVISSFILGLIISLTYMKSSKNHGYSQSYAHTMVIVCVVISAIILLVGNNVARAFGLAGAFSIIRFRNAPASAREIAFVFVSMAAGLGCGVGLYLYSALFTVLLCIFIFVLGKINFGGQAAKILKITIPEDMNYQGAFDEVLSKYTASHQMTRVRTTDLGSLYQLTYNVIIKDGTDEKALMDEIRCLNGNLEVLLILKPEIED